MNKIIQYSTILTALLTAAGCASTRTRKPSLNASAWYGFGDNLSLDESRFDNSPSQSHGIDEGLKGFKLGVEYPIEVKGKKMNLGLKYIHGEAEEDTTQTSTATGGLEGTATFNASANVNAGEVYVQGRKKFKRVMLDGKVGVFVANADGEMSGQGYVSSSDGRFAVGQYFHTSADGVIAGASLGGRASIPIGSDLEVFVGAQYNAGTEAEFDPADTRVQVMGRTGTAKALNSPGSVNMNGLSGEVGIKATF